MQGANEQRPSTARTNPSAGERLLAGALTDIPNATKLQASGIVIICTPPMCRIHGNYADHASDHFLFADHTDYYLSIAENTFLGSSRRSRLQKGHFRVKKCCRWAFNRSASRVETGDTVFCKRSQRGLEVMPAYNELI
jgi:hypothetical protein